MDARTTRTQTTATTTHTLTVNGMSCGSCVQHVTDEVRGIAGVDTVAVDPAASTVTVSGTDVDVDVVRSAITEAGYEPAATVPTVTV
jgi:Cu+-exporting ATPase